jgi:hypothetical protein
MLNELKRKTYQSKSNFNEVDYQIKPNSTQNKKNIKLSHNYFTNPNSPINKAVESNIKHMEDTIYNLKLN